MYSEMADTPDYTWFLPVSCYFLHFRIPVTEQELPPPVLGVGVGTVGIVGLVGVVGIEEDKTLWVFGKKAALFQKKAAL